MDLTEFFLDIFFLQDQIFFLFPPLDFSKATHPLK